MVGRLRKHRDRAPYSKGAGLGNLNPRQGSAFSKPTYLARVRVPPGVRQERHRMRIGVGVSVLGVTWFAQRLVP